MRKLLIPLLLALSFCLPALFIDLIPTWNPHSISASQDKTTAAEVAAAIEEQRAVVLTARTSRELRPVTPAVISTSARPEGTGTERTVMAVLLPASPVAQTLSRSRYSVWWDADRRRPQHPGGSPPSRLSMDRQCQLDNE